MNTEPVTWSALSPAYRKTIQVSTIALATTNRRTRTYRHLRMWTIFVISVTMVTAAASTGHDSWYGNMYDADYSFPSLYRRMLYKRMHHATVEKTNPDVSKDKVDRPWLFAIHLWNGDHNEHINEEGKFEGFLLELINAVCNHAGKHCELVYDNVKNCYHQVEGQRPVAGGGFIEGHVFDDICLMQSDKVHGIEMSAPENSVFYADQYHLIRGLQKEEVDVVFVTPRYVPKEEEHVEEIGPAITCGDPYLYVITRKGSPLRQWFNKSLTEMKESGEYYKVCKDSGKIHGHKFDCV
ncbi:uncharacterized protein LOC144453072 [Glandiceps talaboti]